PHTAYVKIAEGCSHTCSFCIIPKLRGKQRSRPVDDIITEVRNLKGMGVKEFNLIAQDTTDYGSDLHNGTTIEKLFSELAKIPGDHWLRLMYAYPLRFSDELIEIIASSPNFCRYVDIPFQHINGRILKSMHRGSDGRTIRGLVERMRERIPGIAIRSTFIVGYPGETEAEFQELAGFLKEAKLERVGVFTYSDEEGTEAAKLVDRVPEKIKKERRKILMEEQHRIILKKNGHVIGKQIKVLTEKSLGRGRFLGRSEWDAPEIDGSVELRGKSLDAGRFYQARVTGAKPYALVAEI
ncbi:MAG: MiaB/RimO family radical SAM methylthiotransferase, partial [Deltaproteobacteria bacterium]|nr:MiaB/RimO family radical SAM methylthiotransferase [Deltaproteobacteria bacterium]